MAGSPGLRLKALDEDSSELLIKIYMPIIIHESIILFFIFINQAFLPFLPHYSQIS
jgi:hypothetical protein